MTEPQNVFELPEEPDFSEYVQIYGEDGDWPITTFEDDPLEVVHVEFDQPDNPQN